ncbi:MAG TPA: hypothetical protein VFO55_14595 [Gemmatimonadaceae bacterium]|nr:hypothetical protein [Gemmatimonadaceae bacterium]
MVRNRRGAASFGCLFTAVVLVAGAYFGARIGQVYYNFYQYEDTMKQHIRFAETVTDSQLVKRLVAKADSLGLPEEASDVSVERVGRHITISADYVEVVKLPLRNRSFHFTPKAEHDY